MALKTWFMGLCCVGAAACGGSSPGGTGGFPIEHTAAACPAGYVVADSDYTSTNISALSTTGSVLSSSFISSGSAPPGLTTALSGDVVFPSSAPLSHRVVLIDRYPNSVLTWVDPSTAAVLQQLPVGTGFAANPHDYLELSERKAYVSRFESNGNPDQQAFDQGGDLLIIDPQVNTITGRIALAAADDGQLLPRPDHLLRVGKQVWVSLQRFDGDFKTAGDARLVGVDPSTDAVVWSLDIPGVASCGGMALSPSGKVLALSCSGVTGDVEASGAPAPTRRSGLVLLDATTTPPTLQKRVDAATKLAAPLGSALSFASETLLVGVALGDLTSSRSDVAFTFDTSQTEPEVLLDAGAAFALGDVSCAPGCSNLCFLADAAQSGLRVWKASGSTLDALPIIPGDTSVGLPPRSIGAL